MITTGKEDCSETYSYEFGNNSLDPIKEQVSLEFEKINFKQKKNKKELHILKDISGILEPYQVIAVMGPSGAGKSSLLNILAGYRQKFHSGNIYLNGKQINYREYRKICAYIMQDDALLPHLSVMESMMVSANLRISSNISSGEKIHRVSDVLKSIGLFQHRDSDVYSISGGERKRLAIALELISNPSIIFLDEPTSGLDCKSAFTCINIMQKLAVLGHTIVCTIHQPSSKLFEIFTHVHLLASGKTLYRGTREEIVPFMESYNFICPKYHNPADFIIEVASGEYGDAVTVLSDRWKKPENELKKNESLTQKKISSIEFLETSSPEPFKADINKPKKKYCLFSRTNDSLVSIPNSSTDLLKNLSDESLNSKKAKISCSKSDNGSEDLVTVSKLHQFWILTKRSLTTTLRDKMLTLLRFTSTIAIAGLISILYYNIGNNSENVVSNTACMFFSMLFLIFIALMPTVLTFPIEKIVFLREHSNNWYCLKSYYMAKTMADLPFQIVLPIVYCLIVYFSTGQPYDGERFSRYVLIIVITCLVAQSIGLLLGILAPNLSTAIFVAPVTGIPVLLFCGFFIDFESVPIYMKWLTYASFARYSWEGVILSLYGNNRKNLSVSNDDNKTFRLHNGKAVLSFYKIKENIFSDDISRFWVDVCVLSTILVILRIVSYFSLRCMVKMKLN